MRLTESTYQEIVKGFNPRIYARCDQYLLLLAQAQTGFNPRIYARCDSIHIVDYGIILRFNPRIYARCDQAQEALEHRLRVLIHASTQDATAK